MVRATCIAALMLLFAASPSAAETIFVDADAPPGGNGQGWRTAFDDLKEALGVARSGDEIWVADGTYTPAPPNDSRSATFRLVSDVGVYGGFAGDEERRDQRDPRTNVTILSGDLNGDDGPNFENNDENSLHVVTIKGTGPLTVLDGFTITKGNANGQGRKKASGAGIHSRNGGKTRLIDCVLKGNRALGHGGGMLNTNGNLTVMRCVFEGNVAGGGGGFYNISAKPTLIDCIFRENHADAGGAFATLPSLTSTVLLTGCVFERNSAAEGGALASGPGLKTLVNCMFSGNQAVGDGGAIVTWTRGGVALIHCTLADNAAGGLGGGIQQSSHSGVSISNSILWGNRDREGVGERSQVRPGEGREIQINFSTVQGWTGELGGEGNIGDDPRFVDPDGGDFRLTVGSPAIDAADGNVVPDGVDTDLDGNPRSLDDPETENTGRGAGCPVDMGAYEFQRGACGCTGNETLDAQCEDRGRRGTIKAVAGNAVPETTATFRLDDDPDTDVRTTVKSSGKAKVRFKRVRSGQHTVELVECGVSTVTTCP